MNTRFAVLGAGMQGTAAAYDLAKYTDSPSIALGDVSLDQAHKSAKRVNSLVGRDVCKAFEVDALSPQALHAFLELQDVVLSCLPYWMHPRVAKVAVAARTHMCDLGGNTDVTFQTLELDREAAVAGIALVPDCGLAPGLVNSIGLWLIEHLDHADSVNLYCGVLPQHPQPPFNYKLTFNMEGLVTEYDFQATVLRKGEIALIDTLAELEKLKIDELGTMEAFTTSGGTSTAPYSLKGKVHNYEYKTIRYPGHCERMRIFKDFGFWSEESIDVKGVKVAPKAVFCKVFGDKLAAYEDQDLCVVRGIGVGTVSGKPARLQVDIFDKQCEETGFTSMERLTGFSMSIYAIEMAEGRVGPGAVRYENAMSGTKFMNELARRGISVRYS